jgi:hypothetical protein
VYLHISRRSHSHTWGQQAVKWCGEPRDSHQETAGAVRGNVRVYFARFMASFYSLLCVHAPSPRVSMCLCTESIHCPSPSGCHFISCALLHILKLHLLLLSFGRRSISTLILLHSSQRGARDDMATRDRLGCSYTHTHSLIYAL